MDDFGYMDNKIVMKNYMLKIKKENKIENGSMIANLFKLYNFWTLGN